MPKKTLKSRHLDRGTLIHMSRFSIRCHALQSKQHPHLSAEIRDFRVCSDLTCMNTLVYTRSSPYFRYGV
jgi:hypothetical protein